MSGRHLGWGWLLCSCTGSVLRQVLGLLAAVVSGLGCTASLACSWRCRCSVLMLESVGLYTHRAHAHPLPPPFQPAGPRLMS